MCECGKIHWPSQGQKCGVILKKGAKEHRTFLFAFPSSLWSAKYLPLIQSCLGAAISLCSSYFLPSLSVLLPCLYWCELNRLTVFGLNSWQSECLSFWTGFNKENVLRCPLYLPPGWCFVCIWLVWFAMRHK